MSYCVKQKNAAVNVDETNGWMGISSSCDGQYISAVSVTNIYFSSDSGFSWSEPTANSSNTWRCVGMTTTTTVGKVGKYAIAGIDGGAPYLYSNGTGMTQSAGTNLEGGSLAVAASYDGSSGRYVTCNDDGYIYTSSDGNTWVKRTGDTDTWKGVAISDTNTSIIVAVGYGSSSTNGKMIVGRLSMGSYTWSQLTVNKLFTCCAISNDGTIVVGGTEDGDIWLSKYSEGAWSTPVAITITGLASQLWTSIAISDDGNTILAGSLLATGSGVYVLTYVSTNMYSYASRPIASSFISLAGTFVTMSTTEFPPKGYKMAIADGYLSNSSYIYTSTNSGVSCFIKGTMITIKENEIEKEIKIEDFKDHHLIKISNGNFIPVHSVVFNCVSAKHALNVIKKLPKNLFDKNEPVEDLYVIKSHGLLFNSEEFDKHKNSKYEHKPYEIYTDNMKKLCAEHIVGNERIYWNDLKKIMTNDGYVYYYHIVVDKSDKKYGIYSNGILSESFKYSDLKDKDFNEIESFRKQ